jgi:hypothetical protein
MKKQKTKKLYNTCDIKCIVRLEKWVEDYGNVIDSRSGVDGPEVFNSEAFCEMLRNENPAHGTFPHI